MARCWFTGRNPLWRCLERIERGAVPPPSRGSCTSEKLESTPSHLWLEMLLLIILLRACLVVVCLPSGLSFSLNCCLPGVFTCRRVRSNHAALRATPTSAKGHIVCVSHLSCCCLPCFFPRAGQVLQVGAALRAHGLHTGAAACSDWGEKRRTRRRGHGACWRRGGVVSEGTGWPWNSLCYRVCVAAGFCCCFYLREAQS